jgi:hypothetical protein
MRLDGGQRAAFAAALLLAAACGPRKPVEGPAPLPSCVLPTTAVTGATPAERKLTAPYWFRLLLPSYDYNTGQLRRPVRDCTGQLVAWQPSRCGDPEPPEPLEPTPLARKDLVVANAGGADNRRIVWTIAERYANGEAIGPVAITEFVEGGVRARAVGVLRAYPEQVDLHVQKLGTGEVLVAVGSACKEGGSEDCARAVRLLPLGKPRLAAEGIRGASGQCLGPAWFPLQARGEVGHGKARKKYQLHASITYPPDGGIAVHEELVVEDSTEAAREAGVAPVSRIKSDRRIWLDGTSLVASEPSLLGRWMTQLEGGSATAAGQ